MTLPTQPIKKSVCKPYYFLPDKGPLNSPFNRSHNFCYPFLRPDVLSVPPSLVSLLRRSLVAPTPRVVSPLHGVATRSLPLVFTVLSLTTTSPPQADHTTLKGPSRGGRKSYCPPQSMSPSDPPSPTESPRVLPFTVCLTSPFTQNRLPGSTFLCRPK